MAIVLICLLLTFYLAYIQSTISTKNGTDSPVHLFLIKQIKLNNNKLFYEIPGLLNKCKIAALPIFMHKCLSYLQEKQIARLEILINPLISAIFFLFFNYYFRSLKIYLNNLDEMVLNLGFVFFPLLYSFTSARNFGLSSRGIGLLLVNLFILLNLIMIESGVSNIILISVNAFIFSLILFSNTFGAQASIFYAFGIFLFTGNLTFSYSIILGVVLFFMLDPKYSKNYIFATLNFLKHYKKFLIKSHLFIQRESIWEDIFLFWKIKKNGCLECAFYFYQNSIINILLLVPIIPFSIIASLHSLNSSSYSSLDYLNINALIFTLIWLITTLRPLRYLGEPERYIEIGAIFIYLSGYFELYANYNSFFYYYFIYFFIMTLVQVALSYKLSERGSFALKEVRHISSLINERFGNKIKIHFLSNNEQITKILLINNWKFAYLAAVSNDYAGLPTLAIYKKFPYLGINLIRKAIVDYKINVLFIDKRSAENFDDNEYFILTDKKYFVFYDSSRFKVFLLDKH